MTVYGGNDPVTWYNMPRHLVRQASIRIAILLSTPCALIAACVKYADQTLSMLDLDGIMPDDQAYQSFTFVIGFFLVFHTSHAYERLMRGAEMMYTVIADFADVCNLLFAFTRASKAEERKITIFKQHYIRLTSLLFAVCAGELEEGDSQRFQSYRLIDVGTLDANLLERVFDSEHKPEIVSQIVQSLVVDNIATGVLCIPPPLLARAFNTIGDSMIKFFEVKAYKEVPFPVPFVITANFLLAIHWCITPFFMSFWTKGPVGAACYTFITVFTLLTLHHVALELDNPFGTGENNLNMELMQEMINERLLSILNESTAGPLPEVAIMNLQCRYAGRVSGDMCLRTLSERLVTLQPSVHLKEAQESDHLGTASTSTDGSMNPVSSYGIEGAVRAPIFSTGERNRHLASVAESESRSRNSSLATAESVAEGEAVPAAVDCDLPPRRDTEVSEALALCKTAPHCGGIPPAEGGGPVVGGARVDCVRQAALRAVAVDEAGGASA